MAMTPQEIAQAMRYGPRTQGLIRRSQYLDDFLKASAQPEQPIRSGGELAARLLATAILSRSSNKAREDTLEAIRADRQSVADKMIAAFRQQPAPQAPAAPPVAPAAPTGPAGPMVAAPAPLPEPSPPPTPAVAFSPQDRDAMIRMLAVEAGDEPPEGIAAAGHVALNRLRTGYGDAKSLTEVINAPNQFEGMSRAGQVSPEQYQKLAPIADGILSGQIPDPTGGAINFLNPELQVQGWEGRPGMAIPDWAKGPGQRIGRHVFFGGNPGAPQQVAQAVPPPPRPPDPNGPDDQPALPYEVAAAGATPPPPSAPVLSPPDAGTPPVAPPQAAAGGNPQWPTYRPTEAEIGFFQSLIQDPATFEQGLAYGQKLREKMAQPVPAKIVDMNGVQFYVPETPTPGAPPVMIPIPPQAMTRNAPAEQYGVMAPRGTIIAADAYNNLKPVISPPTGQQVASNPGEPYRETFVPGSQNDPYRVQAPATGFAYGPGGRQQYIPGSGQDPAAGTNLVAGEGKLRDDYEAKLKDYMVAREGYQKVIEAAKTRTPAGDIALVFGYMKTLDPPSAVREGEQAQVQNSGTIPETVINLYNKLITGEGRLSDAQRAQFTDAARRQFDVYQRTADALSSRYGELAKSYGYDPARIVRQFEPIEPLSLPRSAQVPLPAAAKATFDGMAARGQIDTSKPQGDKAYPFVARDAATITALDKPENRGKWIIGPDGRLGQIQ